jgi:hypothetical protein
LIKLALVQASGGARMKLQGMTMGLINNVVAGFIPISAKLFFAQKNCEH